jgi:DNA-binding HxlR family transcriptional regulator
VKTYGQQCPIARALDVVGDRWSLLLVRQLILGPQRNVDLARGAPGIPSNVLAARLKELQAAGVIARRQLAPPASVGVYELTPAGQSLRSVLDELRLWGLAFGASARDDDELQSGWIIAAALGRSTTLPQGKSCELHVGMEVFVFGSRDGLLTIRSGSSVDADSVVTLSQQLLLDLMTGRCTVSTAHAAATIIGSRALARRVLHGLSRTLTSRPAAACGH